AENGSTIISWTADGEQERLTAPDGDPFIDVAVADGSSTAGEAAVLGLTKSGKVLAAGKGRFGEEKLPDNLGSKTITYLSTNEGTVSAVDSNGNPVFWGRDTRGFRSLPDDLSGVTEVEANSDFGIALFTDGSVNVWGLTNPGAPPDYNDVEDVPDEISDIAHISLGSQHAVAVGEDGTPYAWGRQIQPGATLPDSLDGLKVNLALAENNNSHFIDVEGGYHTTAQGGRFRPKVPVEDGDVLVDIAVARGNGAIGVTDKGEMRYSAVGNPPIPLPDSVANAYVTGAAASSNAFAAIVGEAPEPEFENTKAPYIADEAAPDEPVASTEPGSTLVGHGGEYSLDPDSVDTQWVVDGDVVPGSEGESAFDVDSDDVGSQIVFREVAERGGEELTTDSESVTV